MLSGDCPPKLTLSDSFKQQPLNQYPIAKWYSESVHPEAGSESESDANSESDSKPPSASVEAASYSGDADVAESDTASLSPLLKWILQQQPFQLQRPSLPGECMSL